MKQLTLPVLMILLSLAGLVAMNLPKDEPVAYQPPAIVEVKPDPPTVAGLPERVNQERAKVNVAPLVIDERLNQSAQVKADDLFNNSYFEHVDANGKSGITIAHEYAPGCNITSENLSWGKYRNTLDSAMKGWIDSKPHYEAMVSPSFVSTGFGIFGNKRVQHFCGY